MASIEIEGLNSTLAELTKFGSRGEKAAEDAVKATAINIRADAVKSIQRGTKSGRIYQRAGGSNLSATHQASAPGQAPATDTGALANSIQFTAKGLAGAVFSRLDYSFWLEYGTLGMAPRPFLAPAAEGRVDFFRRKIEQGLELAAKGFEE